MLTEFWNHKGWIALIPLAIAALAFYAWIGIGAEARKMERTGIETEATIVDTRRTVRPATTSTGQATVARLSYNYFATVMFSTGSALDDTLQIRQVEHFVDADYYDRVTVGDRVWVRYLPDNPDRIELVRGGTQSNSNAAGYVALGMVVLSALVGWLLWAQAAKVHRFKTAGTPVTATVTEVTRSDMFTVLGLTLADGRAVKSLPLKGGNHPYAVGGTVTVLTEPRYPTQALIPPTP